MTEYNEAGAELEVIAGNSTLTARDVVRSGSTFASTVALDSVEAKMDVLNALSDPESLSENQGVVIPLRGILAQETQFRDTSGKMVDGIATYLMSTDGKTYISVSSGIASSVRQLIGIIGDDPAQWPEGLTITPVKKNIGGGKTTWTIKSQIEKGAKK